MCTLGAKYVPKDSILNLMNKETLKQDTSIAVVYIDFIFESVDVQGTAAMDQQTFLTKIYLLPFSYFWGLMTDRFGRRPVMMICLTMTLVGMVCFGLSFSLYMAFITRLFVGLSAGKCGYCTLFVLYGDDHFSGITN